MAHTHGVLDELRDMVRRQVALGSNDFDEIIETCQEDADDADDDIEIGDVVELVDVVDAELAAHVAAQASWPEPTDSERLTLAFRALDVAGIAAREDFSCCNSCGMAEIGAEAAAGSHGFVFFHHQSAERAADGGPLTLAYGSLLPQTRPGDTRAVGEQVAAVLRANGLTVVWNGDPARTIEVRMAWRRRRTGRLAARPGPAPRDGAEVLAEFAVLDEWPGCPIEPDSETELMPARFFANLWLPWLPRGTRVLVRDVSGREWVLRREWDRVVDEAGSVSVPRLRIWEALEPALRGGVLRSLPAGLEPDLLELTYFDSGGTEDPLPIPETLAGCRQRLRDLPAREENFATFTGRSGGVVQVMWEHGPRLWLESPDESAHLSRGRFATLADAERMVTVLAVEDRIALDDLGALETQPW